VVVLGQLVHSVRQVHRGLMVRRVRLVRPGLIVRLVRLVRRGQQDQKVRLENQVRLAHLDHLDPRDPWVQQDLGVRLGLKGHLNQRGHQVH